jgi:hypothetical protein
VHELVTPASSDVVKLRSENIARKMSIPGRSLSTESGDNLRQTKAVVIKMLDLSINTKSNLMRSLAGPKDEPDETRTVFCSVYDYLHHPDWRVMVSVEVRDDELRLIESVRGNSSAVESIIDSCQGSILKEVDLIHQLNSELFFAKVDKGTFPLSPVYFYFNNIDALHSAIVSGELGEAKEVPADLKPEMDSHTTTRTLWARRKNPDAMCTVKAVLHFDGMPKEFVTFHSQAA